jgi:hypothetical protein
MINQGSLKDKSTQPHSERIAPVALSRRVRSRNSRSKQVEDAMHGQIQSPVRRAVRRAGRDFHDRNRAAMLDDMRALGTASTAYEFHQMRARRMRRAARRAVMRALARAASDAIAGIARWWRMRPPVGGTAMLQPR